jgi:hypothetical protein
MQDISSSIILVADAFIKSISLEAGTHKDNINSTIERQA